MPVCDLDAVLRFFLPAYLVIYFGTAVLWRVYVTCKRTGLNPYSLGQTDTAHGFIGLLFRLTILAAVAVVVLYSFWPAGYQYLIPITWLQDSVPVYLGLGLLVISLVWTLIAQAHLGKSWRIGIDAVHPTELVQSGVFRWSRNPIFVGVRLSLLGLFLVLPNAVTLAIFFVGEVLLQIQVRLEEEFLVQRHGEAYKQYRRQTRRWL